ncbi:hypothetical protein P9112_004768 [Eukaryota sp. TZLM1-RC]
MSRRSRRDRRQGRTSRFFSAIGHALGVPTEEEIEQRRQWEEQQRRELETVLELLQLPFGTTSDGRRLVERPHPFFPGLMMVDVVQDEVPRYSASYRDSGRASPPSGRRTMPPVHHERIAPRRNAESMIEQLPETSLVEASSIQDKSCSICLEYFQAREVLVTMPCFHSFHKHCLHRYASVSEVLRCPVCRYSME